MFNPTIRIYSMEQSNNSATLTVPVLKFILWITIIATAVIAPASIIADPRSDATVYVVSMLIEIATLILLNRGRIYLAA